MADELAEHGIEIVALSKDDARAAAVQEKRDGLDRITLLADPGLDVIRLYGVEHHKALNFTTNSFSIGGVPLSMTPSFKTMAIPTSLLIDESGVIRWIDQTDDYRLRSAPEVIREAVRTSFGE